MNSKTVCRYRVAVVALILSGCLGSMVAGQVLDPAVVNELGISQAPQIESVAALPLDSPRATVFSFLRAINEASRGQEAAWGDVFECFDTDFTNPQRAKDTARELWGVFNRLERIGRSTPIPDASQVAERGLDRYTYFPSDRFNRSILRRARGSIVLVKTDSGRWKFSAQTVGGTYDLYTSLDDLRVIKDLADERVGSLALWLRSRVPASLKQDRLLNLEYWQWLGLLMLILVGVVLDHSVRFGLRLLTHRWLARRHATAKAKTVAQAVRPLGLLAAGLLWLALVYLLNLPDRALMVLLASVRLITILSGTWAAWCVTDLISEALAVKAAKTATKFDDVLVPLIRKAMKIFIVAFGLVYSAAALNIPIVPMLTSLGIGGLAVAFAAKDTIENFFGSIAVVLDRPFEVGDWVVINDVEGTVEEVGFRSTRIRTFYNSQVTVPNATLVRATVDNYGRRRYRRVKTHIGIQYDTPPQKVVAFTEGIRELVRSHPMTRKDYFQVWFHGFGASSLDILLYVFHEAPDWSTELRERERLFLDIMRLADQLGVQFAFPTQTVHLHHEDPSSPAHQPSSPPTARTDRDAEIDGIRTAQRLVQDQPWRDEKPGPVQFHAGPSHLEDDPENQIENRTSGN